MKWIVYYYNCNAKKIETYNIFEHGGFREYVKKAAIKYKNKEEFAEQLKRELFYYFGSKCEWEIIITSWTTHITMNELDRLNTEREKTIKENGREPYSLYVNPEIGEKIDVRDQVINNWDVFVDYVWNNRKELLKMKN